MGYPSVIGVVESSASVIFPVLGFSVLSGSVEYLQLVQIVYLSRYPYHFEMVQIG